MPTWQIFSDAGNNFRWEISEQDKQGDAVPRQDMDPHHLPSMTDLLFLGCYELLENGYGDKENPPLFRTGLGKSVAVKQSSKERARLVLGDVDGVPTDTGHLDVGKNGYPSLKPVFEMGSLKSAAMLRSGVQDTAECSASILSSMFQTGSGKTVNISSAGLCKAKTLLGLEENFDGESLHVYDQSQKQSASTELLVRENPSHWENGNSYNLSLSSSTKVLSSFGVSLSRSETKRFSDTMKTVSRPSPIKFHTAGGRSISVSSDALQRARSLLGNLENDSFLNEECTADPVLSVIADEKSSLDHNHDFSTPILQKGTENGDKFLRNFTSPLRSYPYQKNQKQPFGKFRKTRLGNDLMTKFDAEASANTCKEPYKGHTYDRKPLKDNSCSAKLDCVGNTIQPKIDPLKRPVSGTLVDISNTMSTDKTDGRQYLGEKRRPRMIMSVSPFKKPRSSFVTPFNKNSSSVIKDLSRLAPKESCCKQSVSSRYPLQVPRKYLREFVLHPPFQEKLENLPECIKRMNPVVAENYTFQNEEMPTDCFGVDAFFKMLLRSGASTLFMTKEWVSNHYKWIVWKLASYERCYPAKFSGKLLTISNVLEELRYRYEREVNHGHRSAIKKILDGDAPPSSMMVLCISAISENCDSKFGHQAAPVEANVHDKAPKIELTDGWYSVKALVDESLSQKFSFGKLLLGQKLMICGAKLCGWLGPVSPLETSQPSLQLHINGTYRCHWAEKLGFCKNTAVPLAFRCIKGTGGAVPSTLVGVTRIYPILYRERLGNGSFIVRSERMEAQATHLYNQRRDAIAEEILLGFPKETDFDAGNDHESEEGAKVMKLLETAAEPEVLMAGMSSKQLTSFSSYKAKLESTRQSDMQKSIEKAVEAAGLNKREVTPFIRVKVVGLTNKFNPQGVCPRKGLITIWNPTQKQMQELCEGQGYAVGNLLPSSSDSGILYLQARGPTSNWLPLPSATMEKYESFFTPRSSTMISSLGKVPMSSEFDIAAFVVYVGEAYRQGYQQRQWVFVTDGSTAESCWNWTGDALLAINFCGPCADFSSCAPVNSNIAGSVVGFCNLSKRVKDEANGLWVAEATENSNYFLSYDQRGCKHLKEAAAHVLNWASTSNTIAEELKNRVASIIRNSKDGY